MSVCKKLGIGLFVSTTMAGAVVIGIALFNRSHNIKDPFVIATWISLVFITLSALITFNMLVNKTTKKPSYTTPISCSKYVNTDPIINDLQQKHVDNNLYIKSSNTDVTCNPPASLITSDSYLTSNKHCNKNVQQNKRDLLSTDNVDYGLRWSHWGKELQGIKI